MRLHWIALGLTLALAASLSVATVAGQASSEPSPKMMEYLQKGSVHYLQHDFKKAIGPYSQALELEKRAATLDKTFFRVLVDNLGMAYGLTGDLKNAKETFEFGLSRDPEYPLFYYNLACTYAEMNDLDNTIVYLKRAFEYKDNQNPGERMPDPKKDDSFRRFLNDKRFKEALREIKASN